MDRSYVKDLRKLGRNLEKVIIVDNSPMSYQLQPENAIAIKSWFSDKTDTELFTLTEYLESIADSDNVINELNDFMGLTFVNSPCDWRTATRGSWNSPRGVAAKKLILPDYEEQPKERPEEQKLFKHVMR